MTNPRFYVIVSSRLWSYNSGLGPRCKGGNSKTSFVEGKGQHESKTILSQVIHMEIALTGWGWGAVSAQPMLALSSLLSENWPPPTAGVYPWSHVDTHEMKSPSPAAISLVIGDLVRQILAPRNQALSRRSSTAGFSWELEETWGVKGKCVCPSEENSKGSQAAEREWSWYTRKSYNEEQYGSREGIESYFWPQWPLLRLHPATSCLWLLRQHYVSPKFWQVPLFVCLSYFGQVSDSVSLKVRH